MTRYQVWKARERARFRFESEQARARAGKGTLSQFDSARHALLLAQHRASKYGIPEVFVG